MSDVQISENILRVAILNIYRDLNIPATGRLTLSHLEKEWDKTGLRLDDLVRGVQSLVAESDLELHTVQGERCLQLTAKGERDTAKSPSPTVLKERVLTARAIAQAQKRMKARAVPDTSITRGEDDLARRLRAVPDQ